ncbi:hypothetical protein TIFTF001_002657 [Ficus carica]|uniref:PNPLA domain-containing protein n=1 Tax=Ficus carica TaxID=3494 RepID=A0AA88CPV6_FICCA|nr:hypothetical protein TIFTF001_002657 [Ficus carica]
MATVTHHPPKYGKLVTILSVDGGGIRGIIPGVLLEYLESQLQAASTCTSLNAHLSDICIATSAAPTYLPSHYFTNKDKDGKSEEFNLIDGGMAANNPSLAAICEISKQIAKGNPDFETMKAMDCTRFLLITLGTGSNKTEQKYNAKMSAKWGTVSWIYYNGSNPIIDVFSEASADMVNYHNCVLFQAFDSVDNHLRIDDDTLKGDLASVDIATNENLNNLVKKGKELLNKPLTRINLATGIYEPVPNGGTNAEALKSFALQYGKPLQFNKSNRQISNSINKLTCV